MAASQSEDTPRGSVGHPGPLVWLAAAHDALDRAVWAAYGWNDLDPDGTSDEDILGRPLALNRQRAGGGWRPRWARGEAMTAVLCGSKTAGSEPHRVLSDVRHCRRLVRSRGRSRR